MELGHIDNPFVKITRIKSPNGKNFGAFSPGCSLNYILNGRFNPRMDTLRAFFSKIKAFFSIFKTGQWRPPPSPPLPLIALMGTSGYFKGILLQIIDFRNSYFQDTSGCFRIAYISSCIY